MADAEDIQPLVCDNGTGMVKVFFGKNFSLTLRWFGWLCLFVLSFQNIAS